MCQQETRKALRQCRTLERFNKDKSAQKCIISEKNPTVPIGIICIEYIREVYARILRENKNIHVQELKHARANE